MLHQVLDEIFHPNIALDVFVVAKFAHELLPRKICIVGEVVDVVDSVGEIGRALGTVVNVEVKCVRNFEDGEHVECKGALMKLSQQLLPFVYVVGDGFAGVEVC